MRTKDEIKLLEKAICGYLPYKVKAVKNNVIYTITEINTQYDICEFGNENVFIEELKLFLRPMSSMTEEELNECACQSGIKDIECPNWQDIPKEKQFEARLNHAIAVFLTDSNNVDWLNAHHFDYRGLIEKGLALLAPDGMYDF